MQRRTTGPAPRRHRPAASRSEKGLIARAKPAAQSAGPEPALDNRSHRTAWSSAAGEFSPAATCIKRRYPGARHASERNAQGSARLQATPGYAAAYFPAASSSSRVR
jgi:hypothetical protein